MAQMGAVATLWETDAAALELAKAAFAAAGVAVMATTDRPQDGQFDAVLVAGACEVTPEDLFPLLREGGRLIVVEGLGRAARVNLYQKNGGSVSGRPVFDAAAPALAEVPQETGLRVLKPGGVAFLRHRAAHRAAGRSVYVGACAGPGYVTAFFVCRGWGDAWARLESAHEASGDTTE